MASGRKRSQESKRCSPQATVRAWVGGATPPGAERGLDRGQRPSALGAVGRRAHLGVEHVDAEVAEGRFEEVVLGAVLEEGAVHGVGPHLRGVEVTP